MHVTDIGHFLTNDGEVPEDLPPLARKELSRFSTIVTDVTRSKAVNESSMTMLSLKCNMRPKGKVCPGRLFGRLLGDPSTIEWECGYCDNRGVITGWEGTIWDRRQEQQDTAARGWRIDPSSDRVEIPVSTLKGIACFGADDFYDFVSLWIRLNRMREDSVKAKGYVSRRHMTIQSFVHAFQQFVDTSFSDSQAVENAIKRNEIPFSALVVDG